MPYSFLEHTADVRMRVSGKTREKLFRAALLGMAHLLSPTTRCELKTKNEKRKTEAIFLRAPDSSALLIDFLSEVLALSHEEKAIFCNVEFSLLGEKELTARVMGEEVDRFEEDIKAVTYHGADARRNERGEWETVILFDI